MNRRHCAHVVVVVALAVAVRAVLFHHVGIWGDAGYYTYDAMLINDGQTPFIDFIGRSPLFNYAYAWWASVFGRGMVTLRAFIVFWWLLAGVPVYVIGRRVGDHAVGLASLVVFELSPFMLIYGFWANTQSLAAFLAACGVAAVLVLRDWRGYGLAGLALGTAFLSRRSVIVVLGAVGLYALWVGWSDREIQAPVGRGVALVSGFGAVLAVGYLLLARGDPSMAVKFAETHAWGLISSQGRGGFPLISEAAPAEPLGRLESGRVPIFNDLCQLCGEWTVRVFVKTTVASVVAFGPLLYYARDWFERAVPGELHWWASSGVLAIAAYACLVTIRAGYPVRVGVVVGLVGFGYVVARTGMPDASVLYGRQITLPGLVVLALAAGYLYRNRVIHTYYFADFMPFLAVIAGTLYVHMLREGTSA